MKRITNKQVREWVHVLQIEAIYKPKDPTLTEMIDQHVKLVDEHAKLTKELERRLNADRKKK